MYGRGRTMDFPGITVPPQLAGEVPSAVSEEYVDDVEDEAVGAETATATLAPAGSGQVWYMRHRVKRYLPA